MCIGSFRLVRNWLWGKLTRWDLAGEIFLVPYQSFLLSCFVLAIKFTVLTKTSTLLVEHLERMIVHRNKENLYESRCSINQHLLHLLPAFNPFKILLHASLWTTDVSCFIENFFYDSFYLNSSDFFLTLLRVYFIKSSIFGISSISFVSFGIHSFFISIRVNWVEAQYA